MYITEVKKREKIEQLRVYLSEKYKYRVSQYGQSVSYSAFIRQLPFPKLLSAVSSSIQREQVLGLYYYIRTRDGYIEELTPAAEQCKVVSYTLSDKLIS